MPDLDGGDLNYYNSGSFPFVLRQDIEFLKFKAGATAHDMDSGAVEVLYLSAHPENIDADGIFCSWIVELHLGRVRGVHRK